MISDRDLLRENAEHGGPWGEVVLELLSALEDSEAEVDRLSRKVGHLTAKYDEDMEQLRREQDGDLSVVVENIDAVRYAISSAMVFRTSLGQPVIDVGYIWEAIGEGLE